MENYKEDVIATRTGNVGSSDSKMLQQIAELGQVPTSAKKRLAIVKGFCENPNITTPAMRLGDYVEQMTFESLHSQDARWESNKFLKSEKYSRKNCGCITHIDYWLQDDDKKVITIGEQKATVRNYQQAYDEYKFQIYHHYLLTKEYADKIGYKVNVLFCVYDTNSIEDGHEYDPSRLTVKQLRMLERFSKYYHLSDAMDIVDTFLENFTEFYEDEVDGNLLPEKVKTEFDQVTTFLAEIKEREKKVEDFKKKLTEFMVSKGIKGIKTDAWAITLVNESESVSVDYKAIFANEIEAKKPRIANKLKKQYKKVTKKKAYVMIKTKDNND
jgi:hypothetical protein